MRRTREQIYRWQEGSVPERRCLTCRDWLPLVEYRWREKNASYNSECKLCENARRLKSYHRVKA